MSKRHKHTNTRSGAPVVVKLIDGSAITDTFVRRSKSRRWIELEKYGRVAIADVKSFSPIKGPLDLKRLNLSTKAP